MTSPNEQTDPFIAESRWKIVLAGAVIVLAALAAYHNSFSGPFVFDDLVSIVDNPTIRPSWSIPAMLSPPAQATVAGRPLVNVTLAINYALGGTDVWGYHALNLLIHILGGLTLFGVVRRTLVLVGRVIPNPPGAVSIGSNRRVKDNAPYLSDAGDGVWLAFAVALLWTLHPLQTEAVTYIVQRTESLMGLFYLLTLYCFIRGVECQEGAGGPAMGAEAGGPQAGREETRRDREIPPYRVGSGNCRAGSPSFAEPSERRPDPALPLISRASSNVRDPNTPSAVWFTLAVHCCLLGMACKEVMASAPVMVLLYDRTFLAGTFQEAWRRRWRQYLGLAATWLLLGGLVASIGGNRGGTTGIGSGASLGAYALTQFPAVMEYLWLSFWPHPLVFDYGAEWVKDAVDVVPAALVLILLVAGTLVALRRRPAIGFLGAWFLAILAPTSLIPGPRQTMAEHRVYLALAAVISLFVLGVHAWGGRRTLVAWCALAMGLGWLTVSRNEDYRSELSIWSDTAAKRPGNRWVQCNLGMALSEQGRVAEALPHFERGLKLGPDDPAAHNDLGLALAKLGRLPEAVAQYETALRLQPTFAEAHNNLGLALSELNRPAEGLSHLETALRLKPWLATVHFNLGNTLAQLGRTDEAIARFEQAIRFNPKDAAACTNLGNVLARTGRIPDAIRWYEMAGRLDPNDVMAQYNLAMTLAQVGRTSEAIEHFQEVLRLRPNDAEAREYLMRLQASSGARRGR